MNSEKKLAEMEVENVEVLSNGTTSANVTDKQVLISHEQIEETPFYMMSHIEEGTFVCMGDYRLHNEPFKTKDEAKEWATKFNYNLLMVMIELGVKALVKKECINVLM